MDPKSPFTSVPCLQELFYLSTLLRTALSTFGDTSGLYQAQRRLLLHIDRNPGASQTVLADTLKISPAAVTVALKKLETGGYIERRRCEEGDNRVRSTTLTDKGHATIDETIAIFSKLESILFQGFSPEEQQMFMNGLDRIADNLQKELSV